MSHVNNRGPSQDESAGPYHTNPQESAELLLSLCKTGKVEGGLGSITQGDGTGPPPVQVQKPFLGKAVVRGQLSGLSSPPIFVVQLYPALELLVNENHETHETHASSTGNYMMSAQGCE